MTEQCLQYAAIITAQIGEMFNNPECINNIDLADFSDEENLKDFIHALATVAPCSLFNKLTRSEKDHLEFNHLCNHLCFENGTLSED